MNSELIKNKGAAHVIADQINKIIDTEQIPQGKRSKYAIRYHDKNVKPITIKLAEENYRLSEELDTDSKTGLYSERKFKNDGQDVIEDAINLQDVRNIRVDKPRLKKVIVGRADVGFLGYANTLLGKHNSGDAYKIALADLMSCKDPEMKDYRGKKEFMLKGYALTKGDEYGILVHGEVEQAELYLAKLQSEISRRRIGIKGDESLLPASLNIDFVSADEFIDQYLKFAQQNNLVDKNFSQRYFHYLSSLADYKADFHKIIERLDILRDLTIKLIRGELELGIYQQLEPHILKNVFAISEDDLYVLMHDVGELVDEAEFRNRVNIWAKDILKRRLDRAIKQAGVSGISEEDLFLLQSEKDLLQAL